MPPELLFVCGFALFVLVVALAAWFVVTLNRMRKSLDNINRLLLHVADKLYDDTEGKNPCNTAENHVK